MTPTHNTTTNVLIKKYMNLLWVGVNERVMWPVIVEANERKVTVNMMPRTELFNMPVVLSFQIDLIPNVSL